MPYKDKIKEREHKNNYYLQNRETILKHQKEYRLRNIEVIREYDRKRTRRNGISRHKYDSEKAKEYYRKNREHINQNRRNKYNLNPQKSKLYNRIAHKKTKEIIINHYSKGTMSCACCGESVLEFLTIDHIDGGGTKHHKIIKKNGSGFYSWLKTHNFPEGFQVLCWNCNCGRDRTNDKICPHKYNDCQAVPLLANNKRLW